jgi:uncharacterized protein YjiK
MIPPLSRAGLAVLLILVAACRAKREESDAARDSTIVDQRQARLANALARSDSGSVTPLARWILPPALAEISGLALTTDQRLLAHNDEAGRVFELDYRRGMVLKSFWVGTPAIGGDFEAITVSGDRIFLLDSSGKIYEFKEGADGTRVQFTLHDTRLGNECEFEGLTFDPAASALVLACKNIGTKSLRDFVVLYKYSLAAGSDSQATPVKVPLAQVIGANKWKRFSPSDITVDPASGDYILIASQEKGIARITPAGEVVWSRPLPPGHEMAEGIAITKDGLLILSDEVASKAMPGVVTLYRWP